MCECKVATILHRRAIMRTEEAHTFLGDLRKLEQRDHLEAAESSVERSFLGWSNAPSAI